jgi:hypothetical protein
MPGANSAATVLPDHPGLAAAISPVLTKQCRNGLSNAPADLHGRVVADRVARLDEPMVEVDVLVDRKRLIPSSDLADRIGPIHTERGVVRQLRAVRVVIDGVADPEPAGLDQGHRTSHCRRGNSYPMPTDTGHGGIATQPLDASRQVVRSYLAVAVDSCDEGSRARGQGTVEPGRDRRPGVVQQPHPRVLRRAPSHDGGGLVHRSAVSDKNLDLHSALGENRVERPTDRLRLVEDRHQYRNSYHRFTTVLS